MAKETSIDYITGDDFCEFYTEEPKYIRMIKEYQRQYPDQVNIRLEYDDEAGQAVYCRIPKSWFRPPKPPTKRNFTEEQRKEMGERLKKAREK